MDTATLSALVALVIGGATVTLGYVKFITDKENTTTAFRQAWINAVRAEIAALIGASRQEISLRREEERCEIGERESVAKADNAKSSEDKARFAGDAKFYEDALKDFQRTRLAAKHEYQTKLNLVKLYFKLGDPREEQLLRSFVEAKTFADAFCFNADAGDEAQAKQVTEFFLQLDTLYERSNDFARAILKDEWERVKTGEEIYKFTRQILGRFIVGFAICL